VIDHIGMPVSDIARATDFYMKALAPLGIVMIMQISAEQTGHGAAVGFGTDGKPFFWLGEGDKAGDHVHVAFAAQSRADVDAFYHAPLGRRQGQRRAGAASHLSRQLLRRLRARPGRQQHRGRVPRAGLSAQSAKR
jgi:catechol 2,3-dioxygenase-like lactoylglutathione lyase family enzyme